MTSLGLKLKRRSHRTTVRTAHARYILAELFNKAKYEVNLLSNSLEAKVKIGQEQEEIKVWDWPVLLELIKKFLMRDGVQLNIKTRENVNEESSIYKLLNSNLESGKVTINPLTDKYEGGDFVVIDGIALREEREACCSIQPLPLAITPKRQQS